MDLIYQRNYRTPCCHPLAGGTCTQFYCQFSKCCQGKPPNVDTMLRIERVHRLLTADVEKPQTLVIIE